MGRKKAPGLTKRGRIWHIDKQIEGYGRLCESTGESELGKAEKLLMRRVAEITNRYEFGGKPAVIFREAATKYLNETEKRSLDRDALSLTLLDPYIGDLLIDHVHADTLLPFIQDRRKQGIRSGTLTRDLAVVRRILNLAGRKWRHNLPNGKSVPWVDFIPLIEMPRWCDRKQAYPLSWQEQRQFFRLLPDHLYRMALFKVNTGAREEEVCSLQWDWEVIIQELQSSIFIIPSSIVKNKEDRIIVLNKVARSVIDSQRGKHLKYVFTYNDDRLRAGMLNTAWKRAWENAGLPMSDNVRKGPHNLKHTFGRRLRAVGVPYETRKVLLGHKNSDVTTHYSAAELKELIDAVELISIEDSRKTPAMTLLKSTGG